MSSELIAIIIPCLLAAICILVTILVCLYRYLKRKSPDEDHQPDVSLTFPLPRPDTYSFKLSMDDTQYEDGESGGSRRKKKPPPPSTEDENLNEAMSDRILKALGSSGIDTSSKRSTASASVASDVPSFVAVNEVNAVQGTAGKVSGEDESIKVEITSVKEQPSSVTCPTTQTTTVSETPNPASASEQTKTSGPSATVLSSTSRDASSNSTAPAATQSTRSHQDIYNAVGSATSPGGPRTPIKGLEANAKDSLPQCVAKENQTEKVPPASSNSQLEAAVVPSKTTGCAEPLKKPSEPNAENKGSDLNISLSESFTVPAVLKTGKSSNNNSKLNPNAK